MHVFCLAAQGSNSCQLGLVLFLSILHLTCGMVRLSPRSSGDACAMPPASLLQGGWRGPLHHQRRQRPEVLQSWTEQVTAA